MKMRHYIQPLKTFASSSIEGKVWEVTVALIAGVFSYLGFQANVAIIAFPMSAVCLVCLTSRMVSIYFAVKEFIKSRKIT